MERGIGYALKYSVNELKRLFPHVPFLEVNEPEFTRDGIRVKSLEEFMNACDQLKLLVGYSFDIDNGKVMFLTTYQGTLFVIEIAAEELYKATNRLRVERLKRV